MGELLAGNGLIARLEGVRQNMSSVASDLVVNAMGFLGVRYKYGGNDPEEGLDCSGFVRAVYGQTLGMVLPRRAAEQANATQTISRAELKPGDLVFFNTMRSAFSHVGIYIGDNKFIHAPRAGARVRIEDMRESYWTKRFNGARRVDPNASSIAVLPLPR
jgi:cell wall-associated NlpC family hydrolase